MKKQIVMFAALFMCFAFATTAQSSNSHVVWTQVVQMDGGQAFSTSESKGLIIFKLTSDKKLTYKIVVQKLDDGDALSNAHIHIGATGVEGGAILIGLKDGVLNVRSFQTVELSPSQYETLIDDTKPLYVNVHTMKYPGDSIRGQIR